MRLLHSKFYILNSVRGQVAMSLVFLIGGVMIIIGSILTFVVIGFINSTYGYRASNQALSIAYTGVDDALIQLARDRDFSNVSGYCVPSSSCGAGDATVTVTQGAPTAGMATIVSSAQVDRRERKVRTIVSVSTSTNQVNILSSELIR